MAIADDEKAQNILSVEAEALDAAAAEGEALAGAALDEEAPAEIGEPEAEALEPPRARTSEEAARMLEAVLFVAERPLTLEQAAALLELERAQAAAAFEAVRARHRDGCGVVLAEVAGGYQLRTAPEAAAVVRKFLQVKPQRLTRAALETLAMVAYRQPVTRAEIEEIRGVDSGAVLKALLERRLLRILGKKEEPGRPLLYGTTREFLELFSLRDLTALPTLREFRELSEEHREIVEAEAPSPAPPSGLASLAEPEGPDAAAAAAAGPQPPDEALAALEMAMEEAEERSRAAEEALSPPGAESPAEPAAGVPEGSGPGPSGERAG